MIISREIQEKVDLELRNNNSKIVVEFLKEISCDTCDECKYELNAELFNEYLCKYIQTKKEIHILKNSIKDEFHLPYRHRYLKNKHQDQDQIQLSALYFEQLLNKIKPCQKCKKKYNPTNKNRQKTNKPNSEIYQDKNLPKKEIEKWIMNNNNQTSL